MPNKPDRKPRKPRNKRERADKWYLDGLRMIQAGRCACCGEVSDELQAAHIQLHFEGAGTQADVNRPKNIVLACMPCNNKYKKTTMPTPYLPEDSVEQLAGFLLTKLEPKLGAKRAARVDGSGCTILTSKFTENTEVIDWQHSDFGLSSSTICTMVRTVDAEAVLQRFLVEATRSDCPPILPNGSDGDRAKQEMRRTINAVGELRWLATARFWLRNPKFYLMPSGNPKWDSFGEFAFNFGVFDSRRVQAKSAAAEQAARQKAASEAANAAAQAAEAELEVKRAAWAAELEERKAAFRERLAAVKVVEEFSEQQVQKVARLIEHFRELCSETRSLSEFEKLETRLTSWLEDYVWMVEAARVAARDRQLATEDTTGITASSDGSTGDDIFASEEESDTGSKPS